MRSLFEASPEDFVGMDEDGWDTKMRSRVSDIERAADWIGGMRQHREQGAST